MDNTNTPIENQVITWGTTLASGLQDFPTIVYILNTEGLPSDPSALITFVGDPIVSQALYALLSSLNNAHTTAHDKITI
jgi:hypothetical protein